MDYTAEISRECLTKASWIRSRGGVGGLQVPHDSRSRLGQLGNSLCVCLPGVHITDWSHGNILTLSLSNTLVKRKKATRLRHILKRSGFIIFAANSWCYHLLQGRASFFRVERIITAATTYRHTPPHTPKTTAGEEGCVSEQEKKILLRREAKEIGINSGCTCHIRT